MLPNIEFLRGITHWVKIIKLLSSSNPVYQHCEKLLSIYLYNYLTKTFEYTYMAMGILLLFWSFNTRENIFVLLEHTLQSVCTLTQLWFFRHNIRNYIESSDNFINDSGNIFQRACIIYQEKDRGQQKS